MNLNICSILDKQGEFPFGVPKNVLIGFLNMQKTADFVKEILEARKNFNFWKNDRKKVYEVFKAAYGLHEYVWNRLLKEIF